MESHGLQNQNHPINDPEYESDNAAENENSFDEASLDQIQGEDDKDEPRYRNDKYKDEALEMMNTMRKQNLLCDVTLEVEGGFDVRAHKIVLAASSPYLYAMLATSEGGSQRRIALPGVDPIALELLVEYIYTGEINITVENVQVMLPAADLLQLTDVRNVCFDFLRDQLHPSNCLEIRAFADAHGYQDLLSHADSFIEQHFGEIFGGNEILTLAAQVAKFISSDRLGMSSSGRNL